MPTSVTAARIAARSRDADFDASSASQVGDLLSVLAASKPSGRLLELGTGTGFGTIHLLAGMSARSSLTTVELDPKLSRIAQEEIDDGRVEFVVSDAGEWIEDQCRAASLFDLVFADTWPGKFSHLDLTLSLVAPGGIYIVDDLLPQPNWPAGHQSSVDALVDSLSSMNAWRHFKMDHDTGVMICVKAA